MSNPETIKSEVEKIIARLDYKNTGQIREAWKNSLDEDSLAHAWPVSFEEGKLTVAVDNPVYLHNMLLRRKEILEKIRGNPGGEAVSEIRFRMGSVG